MNNREKKKFVRGLIKDVQAMIEERLDMTPDYWDGVELRQYVADKFAEQGSRSFRSGIDRDQKRYHDYKNTVLVNNL